MGMKREIKKLFGNRVALQLVEEEYKGLVVPVPTAEKLHVLSRVVAIGDKVTQNIKVNDILFWQTNAMIQKHCRYDLNGVATFVLLTGDMVARLTEREVTRDNFHVIGDFSLVRREVIQPSKRIFLPDEVIEANQETTVRYILEEKGEGVEGDFQVGDELIVDRTRANPIKLGEQLYCYVHKNFILGVVG